MPRSRTDRPLRATYRGQLSRSAWAIRVALVLGVTITSSTAQGDSARITPTVRAVARCKGAVVNIRGNKMVSHGTAGFDEETRRVNGMGTGVVIDPRGYIITNHHVIDGVRRIHVTLEGGRVYIGRKIAHDPQTDLAIIKIDTAERLPLIPIGTSSNVMLGEPVIAIGNAFGYPHTVSQGIISSLRRTVEVSDSQQYKDLLQTDAAINPGNSGGPLLNIDGQMIGINVAVRVGAQGIAFTIPVDTAMQVASRLMNASRLSGLRHGIAGDTRSAGGSSEFVVRHVAHGSAADESGIRAGDVIRRIGDIDVVRQLDVERALVDEQPGRPVRLELERNAEPIRLTMTLGQTANEPTNDGHSLQFLGMELAVMPDNEFRVLGSATFHGGLQVTDVRPNGPADQQGIRTGDVLVGVHKWQTVSLENIEYIARKGNLAQQGEVSLYFLRSRQQLVKTISGSQFR